MRCSLLQAMVLAAAITASGPAGAWLIYPDRDDPARVIVEIEQPYGDVVPFANLPPPFNRVVHGGEGPASLLFRWATSVRRSARPSSMWARTGKVISSSSSSREN